jgi:hypothetical protein
MTFVDAAGKAQLTAMHREGAEFIADDCLMRALVSEIIANPAGNTNENGRDDIRDRLEVASRRPQHSQSRPLRRKETP